MSSPHPKWDKTLAIFLGLAIAIGLVANLLARYIVGLGDIGAIVVFALLVGVLALVFPRLAAPLPKETVDLWYYALGIATVLAVFASNESERRRLVLTSEYQQALSEKESIDRRLMAFRRTVARPDETFAQLRSQSRAIADSLVSTREYFCRCAMPMAQCPALPGRGLRPSQGMAFDLDEREASRDGYSRLCSDRANAKAEGVWLALSRLTTVSDLSEFDLNALQGNERRVFINELPMSVNDVVLDLVSVLSGAKNLELKRLGLESALADKVTELQKARSRYDDIGGIEGKMEYLSWSFAIGFLWPYVLISLLGIKIARVKYF